MRRGCVAASCRIASTHELTVARALCTSRRAPFFTWRSKARPIARPHKQPVVAGQVAPRRQVPAHIVAPPYVANGGHATPMDKQPQEMEIKDQHSITKMRTAGRLARGILDLAGTLARPGVTTEAIDDAVHTAITSAGAYPSPLGYHGFPKSVCTSVNEVLLHGIPDSRPLEDGDIVNVDVTVYLDGHHGDCSRTFLVGDVDADARRLVAANESCVEEVIKNLRPGMNLQFIGEFVEDYARREGFAIFPEAAGHSIGSVFHAFPPVMHFRNQLSLELKPGMTFTIEPVFVEGEPTFTLWADQWTRSTVDGGWSAQTEHTVLITNRGAEILTSA